MNLPIALVASVGAIALFSFLAVTTWADSRRREREAYYHSETLKKISEMPGDDALAMFRELERNSAQRYLQGIKLAGLVSLALGGGLGAFLSGLSPQSSAYLVGLIPASIGVAFLAYSYLLAPKG